MTTMALQNDYMYRYYRYYRYGINPYTDPESVVRVFLRFFFQMTFRLQADDGPTLNAGLVALWPPVPVWSLACNMMQWSNDTSMIQRSESCLTELKHIPCQHCLPSLTPKLLNSIT